MNFITKDSGTRKKWKSGFNRDDDKTKIKYHLIPLNMITRLAELYTRGANKYGDSNWKLAKTDEEKNRFKESAYRHFMQWMNNELDEDHGMAIVFNVFAYEYLRGKK